MDDAGLYVDDFFLDDLLASIIEDSVANMLETWKEARRNEILMEDIYLYRIAFQLLIKLFEMNFIFEQCCILKVTQTSAEPIPLLILWNWP